MQVGVVLFMIWRLFDGAYSETGKYYQEQAGVPRAGASLPAQAAALYRLSLWLVG